ncbi:MAG: hypothetical protein JWO82_3509 [Akkermansiaceae bacterium]|nr:hypothetical protein [Akkermansiaceae bacterium]
MKPLHDFLQSWDRPFVRGVSDCCAFTAAWLAASTGRAVDCPYLGSHLSDSEASDILRTPGGLRTIAGHFLTAHGCFERDGEPQDGDVVIATRMQGFHSTLLGIWSAGRLVTVAREGLRIVAAKELSNLVSYGH